MLHTNVRYYFAKVATYFGGGQDKVELQEKRERYAQEMLLLLAVELYKRGCRLNAPFEPGKSLFEFRKPDETGHLAFWVLHRDAPNLHFGFNMKIDWSIALESTDRRALFKFESWSSRKRGLFYYGDMRCSVKSEQHKERIAKDMNRIANFVSAEAINFANRYQPRNKPDINL